jgi:hypothetical protein
MADTATVSETTEEIHREEENNTLSEKDPHPLTACRVTRHEVTLILNRTHKFPNAC